MSGDATDGFDIESEPRDRAFKRSECDECGISENNMPVVDVKYGGRDVELCFMCFINLGNAWSREMLVTRARFGYILDEVRKMKGLDEDDGSRSGWDVDACEVCGRESAIYELTDDGHPDGPGHIACPRCL